jgi:hypothetical protein
MDDTDTQDYSSSEHSEKTPRLNFAAWVVIGGALLIGCVFGSVMILRGINNYEQPTTEVTQDYSDWGEREKVASDTEVEKPSSTEVHYLGDERNGYVRVVGEEWEKLDREWSKGVQYYAGLYVLLLSTIDSDSGSAKDFAQSLYDIAVPTLSVENVTLEKTNFGKYDEAYKLIMKNENTASWNVEWIFKAEDDKVHYILIQGTDLESDKFDIPETFVLEIPKE